MKSEYVTPQCCEKPSIAVMDYKWPAFEEEQMWKINRVCLKCNAHWFGVPEDVRQYTGKEWDLMLEESLSDVKK